MGFLSNSLFGDRETKSTNATLELFKQVFGTATSTSGENVTWNTAIQVATVLACARIIANGISQVPFKVMLESVDGRSRVPAREHPLYRLLHRKPNPWQTSFSYRQTIGLHLALCGNHYSFKNVIDGQIVELIPFEPRMVQVERITSGDLKYTVTFDKGFSQVIPPEAIWHIRGLSWNGWMGMEAVSLAREAIGLSMSAEKQQAKLFKNGVRPSGTYSVDGGLTEGAFKALRNMIAEHYSGDNAGAPMILDKGAKWLTSAMTNVDAQQHETRLFQVEEVCRAMGVMPFMVGHSDKTATFASAEQVSINHVVHTLSPYYECIEQSADTDLLSLRDQEQGFYTKFVTEGLLRGSIKDTAEVLDKYTNGGLMTPNEARSKLDLNPDSDPASDKLRIPANIVGKVESQGHQASELAQKSYRIRDLEAKLEAKSVQPVHITFNQEPMNVNVKAGDTTVSSPEVKFSAPITVEQPAQAQAPVVQNTFVMPEVKAPNVMNEFNFSVPSQEVPSITNYFNMPKIDAPNVSIEAVLPSLNVVAQLPARKVQSTTKIQRDKDGAIVESTTKSIETDA